MIAILERIATGAGGLVRVIGELAAWSGLALVLLVAFNVLARYLFSFGTVGLQEGEWHLMAISALFGMSYGLNRGSEVRVDILYEKMPWRMQAVVNLISGVLLFALAVIIAKLSVGYVQNSYSINEGSPDPGGLRHRYVLKAGLPVAFGLLAIQALAMTAENLARLLKPTPFATSV